MRKRRWSVGCGIVLVSLLAFSETVNPRRLPPMDDSHPFGIAGSSEVVCISNVVSISCLFPGAQDWQKLKLPEGAEVGPAKGVLIDHPVIGDDQSIQFAYGQRLFRSADRGIPGLHYLKVKT